MSKQKICLRRLNLFKVQNKESTWWASILRSKYSRNGHMYSCLQNVANIFKPFSAIWFRPSKFLGAPQILHPNFGRGSKKHRFFARNLLGGWIYGGWCLQFTVFKDELCRIIHTLRLMRIESWLRMRLMRDQFNNKRGVVLKSGHFSYRFQSTVVL